ncbi:hypothetical protein [Algoriphagus limi]|uniref:Uncharacterized protein n=1 Tax=Algoriphagus limi TaxID=2975273 RepID=A0ABT2G0S1_9BACT|nr:hypothetical protein [Algoriphagus limi]MCS5488866.1 hypothetical protein [Algoriphagus limi]
MDLDDFNFQEPLDFHPIKIKLNSGIVTILNGFDLSFTYGGVMEGAPGEFLNQIIMEDIKEFKKWGERKMYCISPSPEDYQKVLPFFCCFAWLHSYSTAQDQTADGSELVIQWFEKSIDEKPIPQLIENAVKGIDWSKEAEDFWF